MPARSRSRGRIAARSAVFAAALGLAACSPSSPEAPAAGAGSDAAAPPSSAAPALGAAPAAAATALPVAARSLKEENDLYVFAFAYPAAAGAIPALKARLDADLAEQRAGLVATAKEQRAAARKEGFPYNPLGRWTEWKVVTDLPAWLSLSAEVSSYEGGAHPNHGFDALLWDRRAGAARDPLDLFVSKAALSRAIRRDFCRLLDRERARRRGAPVKPGEMFGDCIDPADSTVILGSSSRRAFDRVGVLVGPYEAGPYAEGSYEVTLPVTPAVLAAVKPEYRAGFVAGR